MLRFSFIIIVILCKFSTDFTFFALFTIFYDRGYYLTFRCHRIHQRPLCQGASQYVTCTVWNIYWKCATLRSVSFFEFNKKCNVREKRRLLLFYFRNKFIWELFSETFIFKTGLVGNIMSEYRFINCTNTLHPIVCSSLWNLLWLKTSVFFHEGNDIEVRL